MNISKLFERRDLWAIGVFRFAEMADIFDPSRGEMIALVGEKGLRRGYAYQSTVADPFLFVNEGRLYLFYEVKTDHSHGEIWARSMGSDGLWKSHGCVLKEQFHLSYPQVIAYDGRILMIPEAAQSGKVLLFEAEDFPYKWKQRMVLVDEPLRDPTVKICGESDIFLFATTEKFELKLYHSDSLLSEFTDTGIIISNDMSVARNAGPIITIGDRSLRPAQDCSTVYGKRIRFQEMQELSKSVYRECATDLEISHNESWMTEGSHHVSHVQFNGMVYIAIDGRRRDWRINSFLLGFLKFWKF